MDLKSKNILVRSDLSSVIADLGLAVIHMVRELSEYRTFHKLYKTNLCVFFREMNWSFLKIRESAPRDT